MQIWMDLWYVTYVADTIYTVNVTFNIKNENSSTIFQQKLSPF